MFAIIPKPQSCNYLHLKTIAFLIWYSRHVYFTRPFCKTHARHVNGHDTDNRVALACTWPISTALPGHHHISPGICSWWQVLSTFLPSFFLFPFSFNTNHVDSRLLKRCTSLIRNKSILLNLSLQFFIHSHYYNVFPFLPLLLFYLTLFSGPLGFFFAFIYTVFLVLFLRTNSIISVVFPPVLRNHF